MFKLESPPESSFMAAVFLVILLSVTANDGYSFNAAAFKF